MVNGCLPLRWVTFKKKRNINVENVGTKILSGGKKQGLTQRGEKGKEGGEGGSFPSRRRRILEQADVKTRAVPSLFLKKRRCWGGKKRQRKLGVTRSLT